ncbi:MAG: slipin family protein [Candidatus Marsarchaeota archaeon]|nr:slipin family protein [Candidatus Marsarchaeota archaeon]
MGEQTVASEARKFAGSAAAGIDALVIIILGGLAIYFEGYLAGSVLTLIIIAIVLSLSLRVVRQWDRMAVLRMGKYVGLIGPGLYAIVPIFDTTPVRVDLRVISTVFSAEKTLTKDNVPVDVDAILFWQARNPEKAVLAVQNYIGSVQLAAQTALRDIIGKNELSSMLSGRDIIGKDIEALIEERITSWGINAISVEIRDVTIPAELQNAMAKVATSDREKQARVILAESESLAADKMLEASKKYQSDIYAMQLRAMNMMYEISLAGKNLMVFVPVESKGFSIPTPIGTLGIADLQKMYGQTIGGADTKQAKKGK